jgi:hypothetical protein
MTAQPLGGHRAPVEVLALVRNTPSECQAGTKVGAVGVRKRGDLMLITLKLRLGVCGTLVERPDQILRVDGARGIGLDDEILLDRPRLGRLGGKVPERLPARLGDLVDSLTKPLDGRELLLRTHNVLQTR